MSLQDTSDNLVGLYSIDFCEALLKVTTIRQLQAALKVALPSPEGAIPDIKCQWKCCKTTLKLKKLNNIKETEKINFPKIKE